MIHMILGSFSYHEVIEMAANIEERGYDLYTKAIEVTDSEPAKNVLNYLAQQEKKHEETFRRMYEETKDKDVITAIELSEESIAYVSSLTDASVFPANEDQFLERIKTLNDVIEIAKQAEKDSILLYTELLSYAPDKATEVFYRLIIEEEKSHLIKIHELDKLIKERGLVY